MSDSLLGLRKTKRIERQRQSVELLFNMLAFYAKTLRDLSALTCKGCQFLVNACFFLFFGICFMVDGLREQVNPADHIVDAVPCLLDLAGARSDLLID